MDETRRRTVVVDGRANHGGEDIATGTIQDLFCDESITGIGYTRTQQGSVTMKSRCSQWTVMARSVLMDVSDQMAELAAEGMSLWRGKPVDALR
jgi:C-terminal processing protease CtpA/Prc